MYLNTFLNTFLYYFFKISSLFIQSIINLKMNEILDIKLVQLDVDPKRDDDASPMSTYRCMLRPTWMISTPQHKSKYKSNSISNFLKKNQIFWFPCCSTREDLSIDVSITNVGLILTKLWWYIFSGCGQTDGQTDTVLESSHGNMSAHKKFQLKAQN